MTIRVYKLNPPIEAREFAIVGDRFLGKEFYEDGTPYLDEKEDKKRRANFTPVLKRFLGLLVAERKFLSKDIPHLLEFSSGRVNVHIANFGREQIRYIGSLPVSPEEVAVLERRDDIYRYSSFGNPNMRGAGIISHLVSREDVDNCIKFVNDMLKRKEAMLTDLEESICKL